MKIGFLLLAFAIGSSCLPSARAALIFSEDFESLPLGPYTSPTETGGDGTDWTDIAPAGWLREQAGTPAGSPAEFFGWTFHDKNSWVATEGDQQRSLWPGGTGTVMVADPDAYDDGTNIDTALYNVYITMPPIPLAGTTAGFLTLTFDSSFRAEATQIASLQYSNNGGTTFTELLSFNGNTLPDGQLFADPVSVTVSNGPFGNAIFRFALIEASNDWWWAVDNVRVFDGAVPEPSSAFLALLPLLGLLRRRRA